MKAIFVTEKPTSCLECEFCGYLADFKDGFRSCFLNEHTFEERDAEEEYLMCPLKPIHALKSAGHDYIIYERQYLYKNLEREYELMKKARECESSISD